MIEVEKIRIAAIVFSVLLLLQIIRAVRREHIRVEYSMAWFGASILLLILSVYEPAIAWLSVFLGVSNPSFVLIPIAGLLFLFTFFRTSIQISELKDNNILLAQKISILEWEVKNQASDINNLQSAVKRRRKDSVKP